MTPQKSYIAKRVDHNLYERGGVFYSCYTLNGKQKWRSLHTTDEAEARRKMLDMPSKKADRQIAELQEIIVSLTQQLHAQNKKNGDKQAQRDVKNQPLSQTFEECLDAIKWQSEHTRKMYSSRSRKVVELCNDTWTQFIKLGPYGIWKQIDGSNSLQNHVFTFLNRFTDYAKEQGLIADLDKWTSQLGKIDHLKVKSRKLLHVPSVKEVQDLINQVALASRESAQLFGFLAYTGCRIGGAVSLTWNKVDKDLVFAEVNEKGDKPRVIYLSAAAQAILREIKGDNPAPTGRVFDFSDGLLRTPRRQLKMAARLLDSPLNTPHLLRHWFTSQAVRVYDTRLLADQLGHSDGGVMLLSVYAHVDHEHAKKAAQELPF